MKKLLFLIIITTAAFADPSLDEQIKTVISQADSLSKLAQQLGSKKAALRIDSLFQADPILKAAGVKIVAGDKDSMWVKVAIDKLDALNQRIVKAELKGVNLSSQPIGSDTLYMRRDRAEKALSVISAALRE